MGVRLMRKWIRKIRNYITFRKMVWVSYCDDEGWRCSECGRAMHSPQSPGGDRCRSCGCKSIGIVRYDAYRIDVAENPVAQMKKIIKTFRRRRRKKALKSVRNRFLRRSGEMYR